MSEDRPEVSVIIPAYNAAAFLAKTLDSVLAQTYQDWTCTVVDDGSSDGTYAVAQAYCEKDARFKAIRQPNGGVSKARNAAIEASPGGYYALLDADDLWVPQKLERQLKIAYSLGVEVVYSNYFIQENCSGTLSLKVNDEWIEPQNKSEHLKGLTRGSLAAVSGILISAKAQERAGLFSEFLLAAEDWDYWIRLGLAGCSAYGITEPLYFRCLHQKNLSYDMDKMLEGALYVAETYFLNGDLGKVLKLPRFAFRNLFTLLGDRCSFWGDQEKWEKVERIFRALCEHDPDGYAQRIMSLLKRVLPLKLFWFVSRYAIIPLAWHIERLGRSSSSATF